MHNSYPLDRGRNAEANRAMGWGQCASTAWGLQEKCTSFWENFMRDEGHWVWSCVCVWSVPVCVVCIYLGRDHKRLSVERSMTGNVVASATAEISIRLRVRAALIALDRLLDILAAAVSLLLLHCNFHLAMKKVTSRANDSSSTSISIRDVEQIEVTFVKCAHSYGTRYGAAGWNASWPAVARLRTAQCERCPARL